MEPERLRLSNLSKKVPLVSWRYAFLLSSLLWVCLTGRDLKECSCSVRPAGLQLQDLTMQQNCQTLEKVPHVWYYMHKYSHGGKLHARRQSVGLHVEAYNVMTATQQHLWREHFSREDQEEVDPSSTGDCQPAALLNARTSLTNHIIIMSVIKPSLHQ